MPDIALRFHKDMLVLSAPIDAVLARQGFDVNQGLEFASLVEPEAVREALRLNAVAGAQCLVAQTTNITPARLAVRGMDDRADEVVEAAFSTAYALKPQHIFAEIAPCGLPLDASSKQSLNEHRDQYARAAKACAQRPFDAFFLNGFTNPTDLKSALMGIHQASDALVMASVNVDAEGMLAGRYPFEEALAVMIEYGAAVVGFATESAVEQAEELTHRACKASDLPVLAQLVVREQNPKQGEATQDNPYYCPDVLVDAGVRLRQAGAQFLRATGNATPAYTGALVAASEGFDVVRPDLED